MTKTSLPFSLFLSLSLSGCVFVDDDADDSSLRVVNQSSFAIVQLHLTDIGNADWGPNLLGGAPLLPNEEVLLTDIECSTYDALLIDETDAECQIQSIDLCFDDATWVIRNSTCDIFNAVTK